MLKRLFLIVIKLLYEPPLDILTQPKEHKNNNVKKSAMNLTVRGLLRCNHLIFKHSFKYHMLINKYIPFIFSTQEWDKNHLDI